MAAKTTLNAKNLEALGAPRLAALLIEISTGNAAHKRRLRMELAGEMSTMEIAREVRKRLSSIDRAKTYIEWNKVKEAKGDLETQRKMIVEKIAPDDPVEAFDLIWQFLHVGESILARSDDGTGTLSESFETAVKYAGALALTTGVRHDLLAEKTFRAVQSNGYGQFNGVITAVAPALGKAGLKELKALFVAWSKEIPPKIENKHRNVVGWSTRGAIYAEEIAERHKDNTIRSALGEIADFEGDVDAYIAQQSAQMRTSPAGAVDIAVRLLSAGRAQQALKALDAAKHRNGTDPDPEWQLVRSGALDALGKKDEAQAFRWTCFEQSLNAGLLREYLKRLPDFDDIEAEEKAFAHVQSHPDFHRALYFFLTWPFPAGLAKLVTSRRKELDGNAYELLTPAAELLAEKHPLAATIALRCMVDFTLNKARSSRYKHAARHLAECKSLATGISDFSPLPPHETYVQTLRRGHGRKPGFWSLVKDL